MSVSHSAFAQWHVSPHLPLSLDDSLNESTGHWSDFAFDELFNFEPEVATDGKISEPINVQESPTSDESRQAQDFRPYVDDSGVSFDDVACRKMKRKAQNRAAQRAFRHRKQSQIRDLQDQVRTLTSKLKQVESEKEDLQEYVVASSQREAREVADSQPPVQLTGRGFDMIRKDLLDVADTLDSTSGHRRGSTHRVLVLGIFACLRSLTSVASCGSGDRGNVRVESDGGCDSNGCQ